MRKSVTILCRRLKLVTLVPALLVATGLWSVSTSAQEVLWTPEDAELLRGGQASLQNGNASGALAVLDQLLQRYPSSMDVQRLRGHALVSLGRMPAAREAFAIALAGGSLSADVLSALLQIDYEADRLPAAVASSRLMLLLEPENTEWIFMHGDLLLQSGQYASAEVIYRALYDRGLVTPTILERLARVAYVDGRLREAALLFERAYYMGSETQELPNSLARLWLELDDLSRSQDWEKLVDDDGDAGIGTALRMLVNGDLDSAEAIAIRLESSGPPQARLDALVLLGRIERERGNEAQSLAHFRRAAELGLGDVDVLVYLGSKAFNDGHPEDTVRYLKQAWELGQKEDTSFLPFLVRAAIESGQGETADRFLVVYMERKGLDRVAQGLIARRAESGTD